MTHEQWILVAVITVCALVIGIGLGYRRGKWAGEQEAMDARLAGSTERLALGLLRDENAQLRIDMNRLLKNQMSG